MHLKNLFSNDFSISEMSAIFPVNGEGCGWDNIPETSTPKRHLFYTRSQRQNKIEFFRRFTITQNPLHLFPTAEKRKKKACTYFSLSSLPITQNYVRNYPICVQSCQLGEMTAVTLMYWVSLEEHAWDS